MENILLIDYAPQTHGFTNVRLNPEGDHLYFIDGTWISKWDYHGETGILIEREDHHSLYHAGWDRAISHNIVGKTLNPDNTYEQFNFTKFLVHYSDVPKLPDVLIEWLHDRPSSVIWFSGGFPDDFLHHNDHYWASAQTVAKWLRNEESEIHWDPLA